MKAVTLFLTIATLFSSTLYAAVTPGQAFYLKVVGGNALTSGAVLRDNNTYELGVTPPPYYNNPPYGDHPLPISVSTSNASELIISPTNPHPGPISGRLALVQEGPGDWTLRKVFQQSDGSWNVGQDSGKLVKVYGWEFKDASWGGTVLRWRDPSCSGRWVAVKTKMTLPEGGQYTRWVIHWFEVTPRNTDTFGKFLSVDLQVSSTP